MAKVFSIRNQKGQYLSRKGEWLSGRETAAIATYVHYDEAVNQLFELGIRAIELRGKVVELSLHDNGKPRVDEFGPEPITADALDSVV